MITSDLEKCTELYINGRWVSSHSEQTIALENPATRQLFARVADGDEVDTEHAVAAARAAHPAWWATPVSKRIQKMECMLECFKKQRERIIALEAMELGSPVAFSRFSHCERQFERIRLFIEAAKKFAWEEKGAASTVIHDPIGVVACITPWNYPLGQIVMKVIPAILAGNTVVLKPSSNTPLTAMLLAQAFHEAGFPAGVINLITGHGSRIGRLLSTHPEVDMVSFTGSTAVGSEIAKLCAGTIKKVCLELGGKSAYIWLPGSNYAPALPKLVSSVFMNSGQTCTSLSRLIVPEADLEKIKPLLVEATRKLRVGDPWDPTTDLGPVASRQQFESVTNYLRLGLKEGARLLVGEIPTSDEKGYFISPAVFVDVNNAMRIAREEIFGPVLCVLTYRTTDEAVAIANDSPYGLSGAVFGPKEEAVKVARRLKTGNVYINDAHRDETAPFGGCKQSGYGREGGMAGLAEFTQTKTILDNGH